MSKVTISDFVIALCELAEAESRSLQIFLASERRSLVRTLRNSGWGLGLIGAAIVSLLLGLGFLTWGGYILCVIFISPLAAPFIVGGIWVCCALIFALLAHRRMRT